MNEGLGKYIDTTKSTGFNKEEFIEYCEKLIKELDTMKKEEETLKNELKNLLKKDNGLYETKTCAYIKKGNKIFIYDKINNAPTFLFKKELK